MSHGCCISILIVVDGYQAGYLIALALWYTASVEGRDPLLAGETASGLEAGANWNEACFQQPLLLLAIPFYGIAGFWTFYKAIYNQYSGVLPLPTPAAFFGSRLHQRSRRSTICLRHAKSDRTEGFFDYFHNMGFFPSLRMTVY